MERKLLSGVCVALYLLLALHTRNPFTCCRLFSTSFLILKNKYHYHTQSKMLMEDKCRNRLKLEYNWCKSGDMWRRLNLLFNLYKYIIFDCTVPFAKKYNLTYDKFLFLCFELSTTWIRMKNDVHFIYKYTKCRTICKV